MAGQRGYMGRSRDDLYAAAESVNEMLAQLKGMRGGRRGSGRGRRDNWNYPPQEPQEWTERQHPEGGWWRGRGRGRPGRHPFAPGMAPPREPERGLRGPQQNRGTSRHREPRDLSEAGLVQQLVMALAQSPGFTMSLLNLLEHHDLRPQEVRITAASNGHLFRLQDEEVSLAPRLKLCAAHSGDSGCQDREGCDSLHMCPKFVLGWCKEKDGCVLGHRWHTDHNLAILRRLSMEYVRYPALRELLRKIHGQRQGGGQHQAGPLDVCNEYNNTGCNQPNCPSLHVCLSFVVGLTNCTEDNCKLNHDLLNPACCHLLRLHQLPLNEAPRDVAMALLQANPRLKNRAGFVPPAKGHPTKAAAQGQDKKKNKDKNAADKRQQSGKNQSTVKKGGKGSSSSSSETESESESDDSNSSGKKNLKVKSSHFSKAKSGHSSKDGSGKKLKQSDSDSEDDADSQSDKGKGRDTTKGNQSPKQQQQDSASPGTKSQASPQPAPRNTTPRRTLWAHYLQGDVADPRICYYSVEAMCRDEATGCPKLHCISHFHWQVKEQAGRWINLRPDQATTIERAFCDPASDSVALPRLDPSKLDSSTSGLLLLLGRDMWQADFVNSHLTNSTNSKTLQLRRLCTETLAGQAIKAATYHWYFLDINNKWVKYGKMDTAGRQDLVSSITSTDIENHYQTTPQQPLIFKNSKFIYMLNFNSMTQTNQSTNVSRKVRRRPEPHLPKEKDKTKAASGSDLPSHWDAMQPEERSRLVTLATDSDEYKNVIKLLGTSVPPAYVVQVDRIQNPFMWCALQNKIKELTALYKSADSVNVKQLFHGTSDSVVASICNENFDWRLHGTAAGQSYGRGTYFGTNAATSYHYCRPGSNGYRNMFVARVAIGSVVAGNSSMARPPINPATSMPYESTTDNPTNPKMIIKYCKQEYYPEYLLTLK